VDLFGCFSLLRKLWPTAAAVGVVVAFWAFPTQSADLFMRAVSERAATISEGLQRSVLPTLEQPASEVRRTP
jgi:hypothetical protein